MKKVVALLLTFTLLLATAGIFFAQQNPTFSDVEQDYATEAIERWAGYGVIQGWGDETFDPYATITRAEFSAALVRVMGFQQMASLTTFADIPSAEGLNAYVLRAAEAGVFEWGGEFRPNAPITGLEAAVALTRALGLDIDDASLTHFADESQLDYITIKHLAVMLDNAFVAGLLPWPVPTSVLGGFFNYMINHTIFDGEITLIIIEPRVGVELPETYSFLVGGEILEFYWHEDRGQIGQYRLAVEGEFGPADIGIIIG